MTMGVGVVILDDDDDTRTSLAEVFEWFGAEARPFASVAEMLNSEPEALQCRLAVLDVNLGEGEPNGLDACSWLQRRGFEGKIVFLTGHAADQPLVRAAASASGTRVLSKPTDITVLEKLFNQARGDDAG